MAIINVYRNLDLDEREIIDAESGNPLFRTVDKIDWENALIIANGNNVDKNYIIQEDDVISVKQYPSAVIAAIAVTAVTVGVIAYGVGTVIVDAIKQSIKNDLKESLKDMNKSMSQGAITQLPSIRGANNQVGNGKVVPFVLGRTLFTPYLCGSYNSIGGEDGFDQYITLLLNVAYNDVDIKNIKVGDFKVASNKEGINDGFLTIDGSYRFTDGGENATQIELISEDRQSKLFPQKVSQSTYNTPIIHTPENTAQGLKENVLILDKFSALNPQKVEVEIDFRALIAYNDEGKETKASARVGLAVSYDDGNTWEGFGQIQGSTGVETITDEKQLAKFNMKKGDSLSVSTFTEQKKRTLRYCGTYNVNFNKIKDATSDKYVIIKVVRYDTDTTDTRVQNAPVLSAIRTWCFDWDKSKTGFVPLTPFSDKLNGKLQRMAIKVKSTQNVKDVLSQINCEVEPKSSIYQNGRWTITKVPTSNPASTVYNLITHKMLGSHVYDLETVDFDKLGELYNFCEEKNIKVNGVLVNQTKLQDVINKVLAIGRSALILENNKYSFWIDKPQEIPVTVLNNHNLLPDISNSKSFEYLPQAYLVKFIDEDNLWQEGEFYLPVEENVDLENPRTIIETIELTWITNYEQAVKHVYYYHATRKLRPETWSRKQGVEGAIVNIGDLVLLQDDTISVGIGDGAEIKDVEVGEGVIVGIITDTFFNIPDDTQEYAVTVNTEKGTRTDKVNPNGKYTNTFYFKTPVSFNDFIQYSQGDIISFGIYEKVTTKALVMGKKQDEDLNYTLSLVPYQEGVYTADTGTIPEYNPQTTTASPSVDLPIIPYDFDKIGKGDAGDKGEDGLTIFIDKPAIVFDADSNGNVISQKVESTVFIQQKGVDVPFFIGDIKQVDGFKLDRTFHTVDIEVLNGNKMANNGVIAVPINYHAIISVADYVDENGNLYLDENGEPYKYIEQSQEEKHLDLYISYAKSIKGATGEEGKPGDRAPKYWGVLDNSPTQNGVLIGDYYINSGRLYPVKARIYRCYDIDKNNIAKWEVLSPAEESSLYNQHVNDLVSLIEGMPNDDETVSFVNGYFELLLANTAFINQLFAKNISILKNGYIQSENFVDNTNGFKIESNGSAQFNKGTFNNVKVRGEVNATSGTFNGVLSSTKGILRDVAIVGNAEIPYIQHTERKPRNNTKESYEIDIDAFDAKTLYQKMGEILNSALTVEKRFDDIVGQYSIIPKENEEGNAYVYFYTDFYGNKTYIRQGVRLQKLNYINTENNHSWETFNIDRRAIVGRDETTGEYKKFTTKDDGATKLVFKQIPNDTFINTVNLTTRTLHATHGYDFSEPIFFYTKGDLFERIVEHYYESPNVATWQKRDVLGYLERTTTRLFCIIEIIPGEPRYEISIYVHGKEVITLDPSQHDSLIIDDKTYETLMI